MATDKKTGEAREPATSAALNRSPKQPERNARHVPIR